MSSVQQTLVRKPDFTVGVIGSAGRKGDGSKMTKDLYSLMLAKLEAVITNELKLDLRKAHLVSGGAAWADHLAVTMFLEQKVAGLTLHLPAQFQDANNPCFHDDGKKSNPGQMANKYHQQFSEKIRENTLEHIRMALLLGAKSNSYNGFKDRNTAVARDSKYLVAFTWNDGDSPKAGSGTADTWKKHSDVWKKHAHAKGKHEELGKIHVPLSSLYQKFSVVKNGISSHVVNTGSTSLLSSQSQVNCVDSLPPSSKSQPSDFSSPSTGPDIAGYTTSREHHGPAIVPDGGSSTDTSRNTIDKKRKSSLEPPDAKRTKI